MFILVGPAKTTTTIITATAAPAALATNLVEAQKMRLAKRQKAPQQSKILVRIFFSFFGILLLILVC